MKVLWIASNGGLYKNNHLKGTGGWIPALQEAISRIEGITLGITFVHPNDDTPVVDDDVYYFPIKVSPKGRFASAYYRWVKNNEQEEIIKKIKVVVEHFKPDLVHIWGVENYYAKVAGVITCPCVAHIQGLISSCIYHYLPPSISEHDLLKSDGLREKLARNGNGAALRLFRNRLLNEEYSISKIKYFIGRTDWDREIISFLVPDSKYFHCDEMLRSSFSDGEWVFHYSGKLIIQSSISVMPYKGFDVILKTSEILCKKGVDFEWNVFGITGKESFLNYYCRREKIDPELIHVSFKGLCDENQIKEGLLESDVYVHPSYIENSSNAIGEAMWLGVPVIAQDVGGNSTMLAEDSGVIVPANEPILLASKIIMMNKPEIANYYSQNARKLAERRHDKLLVVDSLLNVYRSIING